MLTADLVKLRRRRRDAPDGLARVELVPRAGRSAEEIAALVAPFVDAARALDGATRSELVEALDDAVATVDDVRLGRALKKLVLDACDFGDDDVDSASLRAEVFASAADARRAGAFARDAVLAEVGARHGLSATDVEARLFADLKEAQRVRAAAVPSPEALAAALPVAELQAVLLRAEQARFEIEGDARDARALLRALKLHQLLFSCERTEHGLAFVVEGPMALFTQTTRYGLKLALVAPHVLACGRARIEARVKLQKHGRPELFVHTHEGPTTHVDAQLPEQTQALVDAVAARESAWQLTPALDVLALPGTGALVPDLVATHAHTGEQVFIEILGFWSRDAVWRRVELVERGLPFRVVFCVSERLRVSEQALPEDATGRLLVYKGVIPAGRLLDRLDGLARDDKVRAS